MCICLMIDQIAWSITSTYPCAADYIGSTFYCFHTMCDCVDHRTVWLSVDVVDTELWVLCAGGRLQGRWQWYVSRANHSGSFHVSCGKSWHRVVDAVWSGCNQQARVKPSHRVTTSWQCHPAQVYAWETKATVWQAASVTWTAAAAAATYCQAHSRWRSVTNYSHFLLNSKPIVYDCSAA